MKQLKLFTLAIALLTASNTFGQAENVKPISFLGRQKMLNPYRLTNLENNGRTTKRAKWTRTSCPSIADCIRRP